MEDGVIPISACDVEDQESLAAYRSKRTEWIKWLRTDEEHDIWTQLTRMTWNDATFRLLNEGLGIAAESAHKHAIQNRMMIEFAIEGYLAVQLSMIRKLTDDRDDAISLRRLIKDVRKNKRLITRQNYVAFDGVPYDYLPAQERSIERALERSGKRFSAYEALPTIGPDAWGTSLRRHNNFDRIARRESADRSRRDCVADIHIDRIEKITNRDKYKEIIEVCEKFLVHASDQKSRRGRTRQEIPITLNKIAQAHKKLLTACHVLGASIINDADMAAWLPVPQYNNFENLEQSWLPQNATRALRRWWEKHECELQEWRRHALDEILG